MNLEAFQNWSADPQSRSGDYGDVARRSTDQSTNHPWAIIRYQRFRLSIAWLMSTEGIGHWPRRASFWNAMKTNMRSCGSLFALCLCLALTAELIQTYPGKQGGRSIPPNSEDKLEAFTTVSSEELGVSVAICSLIQQRNEEYAFLFSVETTRDGMFDLEHGSRVVLHLVYYDRGLVLLDDEENKAIWIERGRNHYKEWIPFHAPPQACYLQVEFGGSGLRTPPIALKPQKN